MSPDQRREAIVDAALAVARRKGLGATTVRDVAAEMGTSSGLIHHYFDSMDDVLAAAFERVAGEDLAVGRAGGRRRPAIPSPPSGRSSGPTRPRMPIRCSGCGWTRGQRRPDGRPSRRSRAG